MCIWFRQGPRQEVAVGQGPDCDERDNGQTVFRTATQRCRPHAAIDGRVLEELAVECEQFSPVVAVEPSPEPQCLLLDITGVAHLFGGEASLAEKVVRHFARRQWQVRLAIANTMGAAWAVAHYGDTWTIVPPTETIAALSPLPIEALRLPKKTVDLLHELGVYQVEQVAALPREQVSSRLGPELLRRWDQAVGRLAEPIPGPTPPPEFEVAWSADYPTGRRDILESVLDRLIHRLGRQLQQNGRGALKLECRLECLAGQAVPMTVGLFEPSESADYLLGLVLMPWERLRLPSPVTAIHVAATVTAPLVLRQQEMFFLGSGSADHHRRYLAMLVDRLSARLGPDAVLRARLLPDAQPERSWRYDPLVNRPARRRRFSSSSDTLAPRPLRLLRRPVPLQGAVGSAVPGYWVLQGQMHQVFDVWGPERIETGWWRGTTIGRDYYRVETTTGSQFWIFRRLRDQRWFLHGMFE